MTNVTEDSDDVFPNTREAKILSTYILEALYDAMIDTGVSEEMALAVFKKASEKFDSKSWTYRIRRSLLNQ